MTTPDPKRIPNTTARVRFWSKVATGPISECWEWRGHRIGGGTAGALFRYGQFRVGGQGSKRLLAHRVAWTFTYGEPPAGLFVLHRCDNPPCVNPAHLFLGTLSDNSLDMYAKGRRQQRKLKRGGADLDAIERRAYAEDSMSGCLCPHCHQKMRRNGIHGAGYCTRGAPRCRCGDLAFMTLDGRSFCGDCAPPGAQLLVVENRRSA